MLIDDLDGSEAQETVKFGLDGYAYEIDLSTKNATKLRKELAPYVNSGSRVSARTGVRRGGASRSRGAAPAEREQNQAIRAWAQRKGIAVAPRGRIRQEVIDQYHRTAGR
jgi:hypothetical protein